jgi:uncharacterized protein involved in exopolysaccharide biosynthesis
MSERPHGDEILEARLPAFVRDPLGVLRRRALWMAVAFVVPLVAGIAAVELRFVPQYRAKATVLVSSQQFRENLLPSSVPNGAFDKISVMVGETLARENLEKIIEKLDLYPSLRSVVTPAELVAIMRDGVTIEAQASVGPQPHFETAGIFVISFRYDRPDVAAAAANELAAEFAEAGVRLRRQQSQLATQLLRDRLAVTAKALADSEAEVEAFRRRHRAELALGDTDELEESLAALRARLAGERANYTDEHPNIRSIQRELGGLSGQLGNIHARREELVSLERRVTVARRAQRDAQERVQEAELSERLDAAGEGGMASVLDRATPPLFPERTRGKLLLAVLALSLGAAGALGFLLELRDPVIVATDQLSDGFGLQILGGVPAIR